MTILIAGFGIKPLCIYRRDRTLDLRMFVDKMILYFILLKPKNEYP
jgi:hypothetical protein